MFWMLCVFLEIFISLCNSRFEDMTPVNFLSGIDLSFQMTFAQLRVPDILGLDYISAVLSSSDTEYKE